MNPRIEAVLCFLVRDDQVLLARKKKKIGIGRWNGYGGKVEPNETKEEALIRELKQESGVSADPTAIAPVGVIEFENTDEDGAMSCFVVSVYLVSRWKGDARESDEMGPPSWFPCDALPFDEMMPADAVWLPPILKGKTVRARVRYGPRQETLLGPVEITDCSA